MTQLIDIEARALARETRPAIQFRRTATDRPGRPWRQENDAPRPDWFARSEMLKARLLRPQVGGRDSRGTRSSAYEQRLTQALKAVAAGHEILKDIAPEISTSIERARDFMIEAKTRGFVTVTKDQVNGSITCFYALTDAGKQHIAGGVDGQS